MKPDSGSINSSANICPWHRKVSFIRCSGTLNGKKAAGQEKLAEGDRIRFFLSDETVSKFTGSAQTTEKQERKRPAVPPVELDILYEDRHTLFINKPAGMLSQKAAADDVSSPL